MMSLRTSHAWSTCSADINAGAGVQTWTCSATVASAYEAAVDLATWAAAAFATTITTTWGDAGDGRLMATMTASLGPFVSVAPNAAAITLLDFEPDGTYGLRLQSCAGTVYGKRQWLRDTKWRPPMPGAGAGAVSARPPGTEAYRPDVAIAMDDEAVLRLVYAVRAATNPRRAYLYDGATWRLMSVGKIDVPPVAKVRSVRLEVRQ